jgi:hypothetical protein
MQEIRTGGFQAELVTLMWSDCFFREFQTLRNPIELRKKKPFMIFMIGQLKFEYEDENVQ